MQKSEQNKVNYRKLLMKLYKYSYILNCQSYLLNRVQKYIYTKLVFMTLNFPVLNIKQESIISLTAMKEGTMDNNKIVTKVSKKGI